MTNCPRTPAITAPFVAAVVWLAAAGFAQAQNLPRPATGNEVPQGSPLPRILPPPAPGVSPGLAVPPPATPSGAVPAAEVAIGSVAVEGATAYPPAALSAATDGLIGPATPLSRIEAARLALLNRYRGDGYVLTTVTASVARGGALRFIVNEGYISDVKLDGDVGPAGTQVLKFLQHVTEKTPIDTRTLERWLLLAQDIPGISVRAVLRPTGTQPAALTLIAEVQRQAASGLLTLDNRAFRGTGPLEALAVLDLNSFTQFGEKTELSLYKTEGNTQNFGQASSEFFIGGSGLHGHVYYGYGEAAPYGGVVGTVYDGYTTVFGASLTYPLIRTREQTLNLAGFLDGIDTRVLQAVRSKDNLRMARVGADYAVEDLLLGAERAAVNTVVVRLSQGLPFLGGSHDGNPAEQRGITGSGLAFRENYSFLKATFDASRTQTLFSPWDGASVALRARLTGQGSGDILPPAEKFFLGGPEFLRGYYAGQVTGDSALAGTIEAQLNTSFELGWFGRTVPLGTQFYAFYDYGQVWQNVSKAFERGSHISSEGIGARVTVTRYTEFDLEGDIRNNRIPVGSSANVRRLKGEALYWRVLTRF